MMSKLTFAYITLSALGNGSSSRDEVGCQMYWALREIQFVKFDLGQKVMAINVKTLSMFK